MREVEGRANLKPQKKGFDIWLVFLTTVLVAIGLIAIYDATVVAAFRDFGDKLYYFKNQIIWATLGTIALVFFSFFDYHKLLKLSPIILMGTIILLILVLIPHVGTKIYGARRWINIGSFTFQPSEFAKLAIIFYETAIISKFHNFKMNLIDVAIVLFLPALVVIGAVVIEPDLGTALIIMGITTTVYFTGGGPLWHFLISAPLVLGAGILSVFHHPYRLERIKAFLDPSYDPQGASYQINQILIAIASGGLLGVGLGASRSKFAFIPEVQSDAIFAIIVEETGFIGGIFIILLFMLLIKRAIRVATNAKDIEGKVLAMAIVGLFAIQSLFNLASNVALVPLTGIPLPFISYGGSSLFISMVSVGILLNISRHQ